MICAQMMSESRVTVTIKAVSAVADDDDGDDWRRRRKSKQNETVTSFKY